MLKTLETSADSESRSIRADMTEYIRKHRICGCDCRDTGYYTQDPAVSSVLVCTSCGGSKPPCHYFAHFPCTVTCAGQTPVASTDFLLMPVCEFQNSCVYTGDGTSYYGALCTQIDNGGEPFTGQFWSMDIFGSPVTLTYSRGGLTIVYTCSGTWDCYNPNTFTLTSCSEYGGCPGLPMTICITPDLTSNKSNCQQSGHVPSYDNDSDRISCCDNDCDTLK